MKTTPITEQDISSELGRTIKSPIRILNLQDLGINSEAFVDYFSPLFEELDWDEYDPRRLRVEYLKNAFKQEKAAIHEQFKAYFTGQVTVAVFNQWIDRLSPSQKVAFAAIQPWRRRSVAKFEIEEKGDRFYLKRVPVEAFEQAVDEADFRSWPRVFSESPTHHVEHGLFHQFIIKIFFLVRTLQPEVKRASFTAHFMSVKATAATPGDNSPEGAHEDGAAYIAVSYTHLTLPTTPYV